MCESVSENLFLARIQLVFKEGKADVPSEEHPATVLFLRLGGPVVFFLLPLEEEDQAIYRPAPHMACSSAF